MVTATEKHPKITTNAPRLSPADQGRLTVLVQRHLELELKLGRSLESFNARANEILNESGIRVPSTNRIDEMQTEAESLQQLSREVRAAREVLIGRVTKDFGAPVATLSQVIACLSSDRRKNLDRQRDEIRSIVVAAHSDFLQHQVVLFYALDFHRKFLAGVLHNPEDANESTVYKPEGKSQEIPAGNLYRKSC